MRSEHRWCVVIFAFLIAICTAFPQTALDFLHLGEVCDVHFVLHSHDFQKLELEHRNLEAAVEAYERSGELDPAQSAAFFYLGNIVEIILSDS